MIENNNRESNFILYYKNNKIRKAYYGEYLVYNYIKNISVQGRTSINTGDYSHYMLVINNKIISDDMVSISCDSEYVEIDNDHNYVYFNKQDTYTLTLTYKDYSKSINVSVYDITLEII